jgi:hypothetical protein
MLPRAPHSSVARQTLSRPYVPLHSAARCKRPLATQHCHKADALLHAGVLAASQESAVDSPDSYLASYCQATSGPCVNHEQPVGSAAPQVLTLGRAEKLTMQ